MKYLVNLGDMKDVQVCENERSAFALLEGAQEADPFARLYRASGGKRIKLEVWDTYHKMWFGIRDTPNQTPIKVLRAAGISK